MSHALQDAVSLELARQVATLLRASRQPIDMARQNLIRWSAQNAGSPALQRCYSEWQSILERSVDEVCEILCAETEEGRRLRQNSPFAGVLPPQRVWETKRQIRNDRAAIPA
jgi:hypothetical protein